MNQLAIGNAHSKTISSRASGTTGSYQKRKSKIKEKKGKWRGKYVLPVEKNNHQLLLVSYWRRNSVAEAATAAAAPNGQ